MDLGTEAENKIFTMSKITVEVTDDDGNIWEIEMANLAPESSAMLTFKDMIQQSLGGPIVVGSKVELSLSAIKYSHSTKAGILYSLKRKD